VGRILCVDDDQQTNLLKRKILERAGYRVDISISSDEAIERLVTASYDAVITDWRLGEENARRVIQAARLDRDTRIIVVSGFTAEAFQSPGPLADLYLDKPVDPAELLIIIATLLKQRQRLLTGT
jgi:DNA-binding response OmpR family regulator